MEFNKRQQIAFERLEEIMIEDSGEDFNPGEGFKVLPICMDKSCRKIGILIKRRKYWMGREENPELYDRAVSHYNQLDEQRKGGHSHGYCSFHEKKVLEGFSPDEIKKARESLQ